MRPMPISRFDIAPPPPSTLLVITGGAAAASTDTPPRQYSSPSSSSTSSGGIIAMIVIASALALALCLHLLRRFLARHFPLLRAAASSSSDAAVDAAVLPSSARSDDDDHHRVFTVLPSAPPLPPSPSRHFPLLRAAAASSSSSDVVDAAVLPSSARSDDHHHHADSLLPAFTFRSVTGGDIGGSGSDCAICLARFEPEARLRLLRLCCHAFHADCIDTWLSLSQTCPICRSAVYPTESDVRDRMLSVSASFRVEIGSLSRRRRGQPAGEIDSAGGNSRRTYSIGAFDYVVDDYEVSVGSISQWPEER